MRAEDVTGIANKVVKRGERAQELIHKAVIKNPDILGWSDRAEGKGRGPLTKSPIAPTGG
jgi:hypothetical protein